MVHQGSKETYEFIANWIDRNFFFSRNDQWSRFGMLGVLGDFIVQNTPGDIAEIGVGESSIYLTEISKKFRRRIYHCDIAPDKIINPLTVKGYLSEDYTHLYPQDAHIIYQRCVLFSGPSDTFFKDVKFTPLALAFIDGDHNYEQTKKDFDNFSNLVVDDGYIFLHDTYPHCEEYLSEHRCGTVYKLRQELEKDSRYDCFTFGKGTAMDVGLTMVRKRPSNLPHYRK